MGLDVKGTTFLLSAARNGVSFVETATLGRQCLNMSFHSIRAILKAYGFDLPTAELRRLLDEGHGYAEPLLAILGAESCVAVDASDFEGV